MNSRGEIMGTFSASACVVDGFLAAERAAAMRACIDAHFAEPQAHRAETHQVWNYWHVPDLYTYLRTAPEKVIERQLVQAFVEALRAWSVANLGMTAVTWPYLSLYVNGCRQGIHNDARNGRFAFVYSLTRDERATSGGRTILLREGDLFRAHLRAAAAGADFETRIEPKFNRLVIFDDRLPHAVEMVEGVMTPEEGRIVLHGHIGGGGPLVDGPLDPQDVVRRLSEAVLAFTASAKARIRLQSGPLVLRVVIGQDGKVGSCAPLVDRVFASDGSDVGWASLRALLERRIGGLTFPAAARATTVTLPLLFGGGAEPKPSHPPAPQP